MKNLYFTLLLAFGFQLTAQKLPFQGRLLDGGIPFNGTATLQFSITDPSWSETISNVSVTDGYYSVVLGQTTPLPNDLYTDGEATLNITVNSTALSPVTLYDPVADTLIKGRIIITNEAGNEAGYLTGRPTGATLQLSNPDPTDSYNTATVFGGTSGSGENTFWNMYGMNPTGDGQTLLVDAYTTSFDIFGSPFSNGFRRGGIDLYDNTSSFPDFMVALGINRDENGPDPTGKTGLLTLNGTSTRNTFLGGKFWENHNLGVLQIFGQNDDGGGDFTTNIQLEATNNAGASGGAIQMGNSANGGTYNEIILLNTTDGTSQGGLISVNDNSGASQITLDGGSGDIVAAAFNQSSDRRLKKNIEPIENALESVQELQGVSYTWKDPSKTQKNQIGVIAQEVEAIYPEFVHTKADGYKAVNYAQMTAVLIEAIKELNAKVETLEAENAGLKTQVASIEKMQADIAQLKELLGHGKAASK